MKTVYIQFDVHVLELELLSVCTECVGLLYSNCVSETNTHNCQEHAAYKLLQISELLLTRKYSLKLYKHFDSRTSTESCRFRISSKVRKTLKELADPLMGFAELAHLYQLYCILSRMGYKMCSTKSHCRLSRWQCDIRRRSAGIEASNSVCGCGCLCLLCVVQAAASATS